jgi:hypothetical protein
MPPDLLAIATDASAKTTTWRPLGDVAAPIIKRLTVDMALKRVIPKFVASHIVGGDWLRNA